MTKKTLIAATACVVTSLNVMAEKFDYPTPPTSDTVDTYFGIRVADPYRPLENDTAAVTLEWVEAENDLTNAYLNEIPFRNDLRDRITAFQNYKRSGLPWRADDGRYYFFENSGLQNQSVLYRKATLDGEAELFLDPNALSDDGTVALTGHVMSPDGKYVAYTISRSGSDWTEIYLLDTETGKQLDDHIVWAKFTSVAWDGSKGFYYSAYDKPADGTELSGTNENHKIYYHEIGTPQSADTLFFEDPEHPLHFHSAWIPRDSRYIFVFVGGQGFGQAIMYKDLDEPIAVWNYLEPTQDNILNIVGVKNNRIYFTTSIDAPRYRLMSADLNNPDRQIWKEVIPQDEKAVLSNAQFAGDRLIVTFNRDASDHVAVYDLEGNLVNEIQLPMLGSVAVSSDQNHDDVFYSVTSYLAPWQHYAYDLQTGESTLINKAKIEGFNPDEYVTEEFFYPSADGTMVHAFMTHKKDIKLDGSNPTLIYGYGGFNIGQYPYFSSIRLPWLENGGIYVVTNLRGGSEYGDEWHEAGTKLNKMNVFNDFIGAAEYMIEKGYTKPENIVIEGGSNGGLLVAACANLRPDLFGVAIPMVGVQDMMRYHLFTIGWNWAPDYGTSADSPEMAEYLLSYSPLHNIKNDGTPYPAILVLTADHDDRVVPAHSFKYAAALQAANTGDKPKLIRIESKAGHGAGKPISKTIDEWTDVYSFVFRNLGITPKK